MANDVNEPILDGAEAPAWRLIATLAAAGGLAGLALVLVFQWAEPRIRAHQAEALRVAVHQVLHEPERYETLYVMDGRLTSTVAAGIDSVSLDRVYLGYDAAGQPVGFAITGAEPGFQDLVRLIFGYDPASGQILGMRVLESKETPGLGDKIEKDAAFVDAFEGVTAPVSGVKPGGGTGDAHEVDMITGATISSRVVIGIINHRLEELESLLETYPRVTTTVEGRTP